MAFASIQQLKTALNRGARANLFEIEIAFPTNLVSTTLPGGIAAADLPSDIATRAKIMCKAAAVPGFTVGTIEVPFRAGRRI